MKTGEKLLPSIDENLYCIYLSKPIYKENPYLTEGLVSQCDCNLIMSKRTSNTPQPCLEFAIYPNKFAYIVLLPTITN